MAADLISYLILAGRVPTAIEDVGLNDEIPIRRSRPEHFDMDQRAPVLCADCFAPVLLAADWMTFIASSPQRARIRIY
jgi:hypothetical protein